MYAIISTGGKQYKVVNDDVLEIERLPGDVGSKIEITDVLAVGENEKVELGTPYLKKGSVKAEIVDHYRGGKVTVFKMKRRKGYRRKQGHRQEMTKIKITDIIGEKIKKSAVEDDKKPSNKETAPEEKEKVPKKDSVKEKKETAPVKEEKAEKKEKVEKDKK